MEDIGLRLQHIRKKRGLTQKDLANRIHKSSSAISSYETNSQLPPLDVLISISLSLGVSLDYLAGLECREYISIEKLSNQQKDLIVKLTSEFLSPSSNEKELSVSQKEILEKLLYLFIE